MSANTWLCLAVFVLSIGSAVNTNSYIQLKKRIEILELKYEAIK